LAALRWCYDRVLIAVLFFVDIPILYKLFPAEVRTW
jgi:hypothetical protein